MSSDGIWKILNLTTSQRRNLEPRNFATSNLKPRNLATSQPRNSETLNPTIHRQKYAYISSEPYYYNNCWAAARKTAKQNKNK